MAENMNQRIYLDRDWYFSKEFSQEICDKSYDESEMEKVIIPHTCQETPLHYFDENMYQMVSGYRKAIYAEPSWEGKHVLLTFEGVGHVCEVYVNGKPVGGHKCGYTAFTIDIAPFLIYGSENILAVKVDSREQQNVPPFGFVIDYMTYGGIYRDVYLEVKNEVYIKDVFVHTKQELKNKTINKQTGQAACPATVFSDVTVYKNDQDENGEKEKNKKAYLIRQFLQKKEDASEEILLGEMEMSGASDHLVLHSKRKLEEACLWDIDHPTLYILRTQLLSQDEKGEEILLDEKCVTCGFRTAVFKKEGFYLNGKKVKIFGVNRHQSYPYVGYAMPSSMQKLDADILKNELSLNAVRTSHYPQSQDFINHCDEIGLMVFTEMPGWQHIGDESWKDQAVENVKDMVLQYRNHPSIILWGVRINESVDDDAFYERTNKVAHELDPYRQTGGVRCYKKSNLLEDVYTYNDFLHDGVKKGCDKKSDVTSNVEKGYLISEYNGHMFPTKAFDCEEHRVEHALRHANVINEVAKQGDIAGSFAWCMFDYNTHKDFGSGDRICYHGVMDMFRNPKLAADVYASQQDEKPVLNVMSAMDIGEHPGCNRGKSFVLTNADSVKMYKNDELIKEYKQEDSPYKYMKHGPVYIDDYVGDVLVTKEGFSPKKAKLTKEILNEAAEVGVYRLSLATYIKAGKLMLLYHMKPSDAVDLFTRYVGNWGGESTEYRFDAVKDGKVTASCIKKPMMKMQLDAKVDHTKLVEDHTYDVAAVRVSMNDENGNVLNYYNDPVSFEVSGPVELIGPNIISFSGGMCGCYVKTKGESGKAQLIIRSGQAVVKIIDFEVDASAEA